MHFLGHRTGRVLGVYSRPEDKEDNLKASCIYSRCLSSNMDLEDGNHCDWSLALYDRIG